MGRATACGGPVRHRVLPASRPGRAPPVCSARSRGVHSGVRRGCARLGRPLPSYLVRPCLPCGAVRGQTSSSAALGPGGGGVDGWGGGGHRKPTGRCAGHKGIASAGGRRAPGTGRAGRSAALSASAERPRAPWGCGSGQGLYGRSAGFSSHAVPQLPRVALGVLKRAAWLRCLPGPNVRCERQSDKGGDGGSDIKGDIGGDKGGDTKEQRPRSSRLVSSRIVGGKRSDFLFCCLLCSGSGVWGLGWWPYRKRAAALAEDTATAGGRRAPGGIGEGAVRELLSGRARPAGPSGCGRVPQAGQRRSGQLQPGLLRC